MAFPDGEEVISVSDQALCELATKHRFGGKGRSDSNITMATHEAQQTAPPESLGSSGNTTAIMIQKTYRGYRARRKLADAAIMAKRWNIVDAVVLQHTTQDFYAHSKAWKSRDKWDRLKRKASKVGKGLSKDHKAIKLTLQHWLEAVDSRHRYGHNLHHYYLHWINCDTHEPFFYWLDVGEGREVEVEKCSRSKLQKQQIKYLSPDQRKHYEVAIYNGKLYFRLSSELVHTPGSDRWIFVMSPYGKLYVGKVILCLLESNQKLTYHQMMCPDPYTSHLMAASLIQGVAMHTQKVKGSFQHSSFLAGGATTAAGRLNVNHGRLELMEAHSGHYQPSPESFEKLVKILVERGADLTMANVQLVSDDMLQSSSFDRLHDEKLCNDMKSAIKETCTEEGVAVRIGTPHLVSSASMADEAGVFLVTDLTFPNEKVNNLAQEPAKKDDSVNLHKEDMKWEETLQKAIGAYTVEEKKSDGTVIPNPVVTPQEDIRPSGLTRNSALMSLSMSHRVKALQVFEPSESAADACRTCEGSLEGPVLQVAAN